jgi:signal transduction histidine kinase
MLFPPRFLPRSITAQVAILVAAAVFLGDVLTGGFLPLLQGTASPSRIATRIATVTQLAQSARSPAEMGDLLAIARRSGIFVRQVPLAQLAPVPANARDRSLFVRLIIADLKLRWGIFPLPKLVIPERFANGIIVPFSNGTVLAFEAGAADITLLKMWGLATLELMIVSLFIALAAVYVIRWITSPLSFIASTARAFGHSPTHDDALPETGPTEIVQVAQAFNDMRSRIRALVDARARMLAAISHDLRTPLTRLQLRAERVADTEARNGMSRDIGLIDELLGETLTYLREGVLTESVQRTDLPSLLQTICSEFTDVGHSVSYEGPHRMVFACRRRALARAVRNIVDNGVKHGSSVTVKLHTPPGYPVQPGGLVQMDICDDGPGIAAPIRNQVFEPFFKGDGARTSSVRGGFGLGLSIARDIIRDHGGEIELLDGTAKGLTVRISLTEMSLNNT